jgi:hypothetical protein
VVIFFSLFNRNHIRFRAGIEAEAAADAALTDIHDGLDATAVEVVREAQALLRAGDSASHAAFALVSIDHRMRGSCFRGLRGGHVFKSPIVKKKRSNHSEIETK